jgi:hypothetical protein
MNDAPLVEEHESGQRLVQYLPDRLLVEAFASAEAINTQHS